jgi:nucleoside-diphosphate-sugar epimerase
MRVILIGANGLVGSAFARKLSKTPGVELVPVVRATYDQLVGTSADVVIEAACNSRKFFAEEKPVEEFETSVTHRLKSLFDFPAPFHLHISSVDVYSDLTSPETTREDCQIDLGKASHYGFHKLLAEELVRHYAKKWLVARLAGMVGPGLRKNPVFDILNGQPLRIHPDSQYQFMHTDEVARVVWALFESGAHNEVFNVAGEGLVSPREIAALAGKTMDLSALPAHSSPRKVHVCLEKISARFSMPKTSLALERFAKEAQGVKRA